MDEPAYLIPLILVLFPLFFVSLWVFILFVLSFVSGWRRLASRYHWPKPFRGKVAYFQTARLNWVNFRSALEIGANEQGLYLAPMIFFRLFHQPLLIPWSEIEAKPFNRFLFKGQRLTFRSFPGIKLDIYSQTFENMQGYLLESPADEATLS
jgi:hypothetical protein